MTCLEQSTIRRYRPALILVATVRMAALQGKAKIDVDTNWRNLRRMWPKGERARNMEVVR